MKQIKATGKGIEIVKTENDADIFTKLENFGALVFEIGWEEYTAKADPEKLEKIKEIIYDEGGEVIDEGETFVNFNYI